MNTKTKSQKSSTTPYTVRLDTELKNALEREARLEDRTPAQLATRAIKNMLKAKAAKREALEEALVEADKGVFISSDAMQSWIKSWDTENELPRPEPDIKPK